MELSEYLRDSRNFFRPHVREERGLLPPVRGVVEQALAQEIAPVGRVELGVAEPPRRDVTTFYMELLTYCVFVATLEPFVADSPAVVT